jgi:hypothetical protein
MNSLIPKRFTLALGGDCYERIQQSKLRHGDLVGIKPAWWNMWLAGLTAEVITEPAWWNLWLSWSTTIKQHGRTVWSVSEHVAKVEHALKQRSKGHNPFGVHWQEACTIYRRDLESRIGDVVFRKSRVGTLRDTAKEYTINQAVQRLEDYIRSDFSLEHEDIFLEGHGWVFYILEKSLGDALREANRRLPIEGGGEGAYNESHLSLPDVEKSLAHAGAQAMKIIEMIASSRNPLRRFQIFDSGTAEAIKATQWSLNEGSVPSSVKKAWKRDHRFELRWLDTSRDKLYACLTQYMGAFRRHEVALAEHRAPWQASSAGLGAGYVAWTVTDKSTYNTLLGFSPIFEIGPGLTHKVSRGLWHLVALTNEGIHYVLSNKGYFGILLLVSVLLCTYFLLLDSKEPWVLLASWYKARVWNH